MEATVHLVETNLTKQTALPHSPVDSTMVTGLPDPILVGALVMALMKVVKRSPISNWLIPYFAFAIGGAAFVALRGFDGRNLIEGLLIGGSAIGLHQVFRQTADARRENDGETRFLEKKDIEKPS